MSEYQLNQHDLEGISYLAVNNPYLYASEDIHLFALRDVVRAAYLKHGGPDELKEAQRKSALHKEHLRQTKEIQYRLLASKLEAAKASTPATGTDSAATSSSGKLTTELPSHIDTYTASLKLARRRKRQRRRAQREASVQQRREGLKAALRQRGYNFSDLGINGSEICLDFIHGYKRAPLEGVVDDEVARQHRKQELVASLATRGLELRGDSSVCRQYIAGVNEFSLAKTVDIVDEMHFYFKYTKYTRIEEWKMNRFGEYMHTIISDNAKSQALSTFVEEYGLEKVLALPDLPPTLRRQLEQQHGAGK